MVVQKDFLQYGIHGVGFLMMIWLMVQERDQVNDAVLVTIGILAVSCIMAFFEKSVGNENRKGTIFSAALLSLLFECQISLQELYIAPFMENLPLTVKFLLGIALYANIFMVIFFVLTSAQKAISRNVQEKVFCAQESIDSNAKYFLCKFLVLAETLLYLLSTFPGIWLQSDAAGVYHAATAEIWDAWHTIGYVWFVRLCTWIWESPYAVNVVQAVLWIVLNFYIIDMLAKRNRKAVYLYTVLTCLTSVPFLCLENLSKDTVFSIGVLGISVFIYRIIDAEELSKKEMVLFCVLSLFALLCRHGGAVPVLGATAVTAIFFAIKKKRKATKQMLISLVWFVFAYVLVNVVLSQALQVTKSPAYVKYSIPMSMVGAAVSQGVQFSEEDTAILERIMPLEDWGACYNRYWADDISRSWGKIGQENIDRLAAEVDHNGFGKELLRINLKLLISHPDVYLNAFFDMNSIMWELCRPNDVPVHFVALVPEDEQIRYSAAYELTSQWTQFLDNFSLTRATITRGGFSLFVLLFCAVLFWQHEKSSLIAFLPIFLVDLMLSITIPAQDPRYVLPTFECAMLFLALVASRAYRTN